MVFRAAPASCSMNASGFSPLAKMAARRSCAQTSLRGVGQTTQTQPNLPQTYPGDELAGSHLLLVARVDEAGRPLLAVAGTGSLAGAGQSSTRRTCAQGARSIANRSVGGARAWLTAARRRTTCG